MVQAKTFVMVATAVLVDVAAGWRLTHDVVYRVEGVGGDGGALQRGNHR